MTIKLRRALASPMHPEIPNSMSESNDEITGSKASISGDLLCCSIPARLPDGRRNPEYSRAYAQRRKAEGRPIPNAEYQRAYYHRRKAEGRPIKSPEQIKQWNESAKGKAARARYMASKKGQRKRHETGEEYADRIIRELEEIYQHNASMEQPRAEKDV
jgi:hypothetical protein